MLATPAAISAATVHLNTTGNRPLGASVNTFRSLPVPPRCSQGLIRPSISRPQGVLRNHDQHPDLRKTRMCPSVASSTKCPYSAEDCRFAHSQSELRVSFDRFYKVQPCAFYDRGKCRNGGEQLCVVCATIARFGGDLPISFVLLLRSLPLCTRPSRAEERRSAKLRCDTSSTQFSHLRAIPDSDEHICVTGVRW